MEFVFHLQWHLYVFTPVLIVVGKEEAVDVDKCIEYFDKNIGFDSNNDIPLRSDLRYFAGFLKEHSREVPFKSLLNLPIYEYYQEVRVLM